MKGQDLVGALILHAILTHDQLNIDQLVHVTNLPEPRVRSTVKDLAGRGIVEDGERDTTRIRILAMVPAVRLLRRLNLIPWTV